jgi:phage shock protein E
MFPFSKPAKTPDLQALVASGALLIDVRTPIEYSEGHIPGALNIPVQELTARLAELGDKQREIVLYCRSGARSGHAASQLRSQGFQRVHNLGAMSNWPSASRATGS